MVIAEKLAAAIARFDGDSQRQVLHFAEFLIAKRGKALPADCATLYSEDMQVGQVFEGNLTVKNPFVLV